MMTTEEPKPACRIVLVDDHAAFVDLLRFALDGQDDLECVGSASCLADAEAAVAAYAPDIVVVDLGLGDEDGLEVVRRLRARWPELVIVVASARADSGTLASVATAGGNGFAPKSGALAELLSILRSARPGMMSVASSVLPAAAEPARERLPGRLTGREREMLTFMARGVSVPAMAESLGISVNTCRTHLRAVHSKLGVHTRLAAVLKARSIGLLEPSDEAPPPSSTVDG
jgi:DNA-binding NarL/FixJ family response regulator